MTQWDIVLYPFSEAGSHPAVIISPPERCRNPQTFMLNGLICTSFGQNRKVRVAEVLLDESDGLDWRSLVRCDVIHALDKRKFGEKRGQVRLERRYEISRKIIESFRLQTR